MIYLDNHATTQCDPRVVCEMLPYFDEFFGNPASNHSYGEISAEAVNKSIKQISGFINCNDAEIVITSGATESNNLAILGITNGKLSSTGWKKKIVTTKIEHKSVLGPYNELERLGWVIEYLAIDNDGLVDLDKAKQVIDDNTYLVSVQLANSEIGTIQPISSLTEFTRLRGAFFHCDASQAVGKIEVDVMKLGVDFLSLSGHKFYGPKGIGALYIREGLKNSITPIMFGGNTVLRPGTPPVPLIVGLSSACNLCKDFIVENIKIAQYRDLFEEIILAGIPNSTVNGAKKNRLPNNSNITFPIIEAELLMLNLPEIIMSTGSACESGSIEPSKVLLNIGIAYDEAYCTIRFGFGRFTSIENVKDAANSIVQTYNILLQSFK